MEHKKMDSDSSQPSGDDSVARFGRDVSPVWMVIRAAREMTRLHAEACNVNEQDLWIVNGPEFLEEAEKVVAVTGAPEMLEALRSIETRLRALYYSGAVLSNDEEAILSDAHAAIARATGAPQ